MNIMKIKINEKKLHELHVAYSNDTYKWSRDLPITMYYALTKIPGTYIEVSHELGETICGKRYAEVMIFLRNHKFITCSATRRKTVVYSIIDRKGDIGKSYSSFIVVDGLEELILKNIKGVN